MKYRKLFSFLLIVSLLFVNSSALNRAIIHTQPNIKVKRKSTKVSKMIYNSKSVSGKSENIYVVKKTPYPLYIKTYDGSNQANHPKVLYFSKGWNGWKYWMSFTPYPYGNASLENPSIAVSNDGENWTTPDKAAEPVVNAPKDAEKGGHNSDPHLVMYGHNLELWYRYNPSQKRASSTNNHINQIYMIETANGVKWSKPRLIFNDNFKYFSPAIIYDDNIYKVWFSDENGKLYCKQSQDLNNWSNAKAVNLSIPGYHIWHQDVIKTDYGYQIVFSAYKDGEFSLNNQCLYYADSPDGINFSTPVLILAPSLKTDFLDNQMIYRSSLVDVSGNFKLYYSAMSKNKEWHIFCADFKPGERKTTKF